MSYQISTDTPDVTIATPAAAGVGCVRIIIGLTGGLFALIGLSLLLVWRPAAFTPGSLLGMLVAFMGVGFIVLAIFMKTSRVGAATELRFDQDLGALRVRNAGGTPAEVFLDYANVAGFTIETRSKHDSGNNSRHSSSSTTYTYHVVLQLHDGGRWHLAESASKAEAEEQVQRLTQAVPPGARARQPLPPAVLPPTLDYQQQGRQTTLGWRNEVTNNGLLGFITTFVFFGGTLGFFFLVSQKLDLPTLPLYAVLGFIGLVFLYIMVSKVRRLRRDARHRYELVFSLESVEYREVALASGQVALRQEIPRAEWYGLSCSFDDTSTGDEAVLLLTKAAHAQYLHQQQAQQLPWREILQVLTEKELSRSLYFRDFTPVQRLALVSWVRANA